MKTNAFTLLEMLLVLSISLTMVTLTIFPISNTISTLTEKQLLEEMKATIYYAQLYAITSGQETMITFSPPENQLTAATINNSLITVSFSNSLKLNQSRSEKFRFSGLDGSINRFTTVRFIGKAKNYKLIFQIGKGRFRIELD
ncbi:competence type IV pilus minor pilin ComGD [Listeria ivanovii]|uniref:Putative comG operon protein 4 (ComGD) n=1 Tax=Listeria ivanovii (strain ATCC BAA-678 / PAM 55) TaxID=881621 RepID=G2ZFP8_LISIP|nr:competence type IV pilus minor pilin ComGD [Listeria ivanovii]AHI55840.1 competence protein ComG [Listeria ivanovii WSLC3009]AIS65284.1 competence protein ComG [Listeria ivanovii subsp. ivanovii]MBC1760056.1 competence protein ComG [Listeria ivanovii]MCJ1717590.1 prepilin-type N-terminal cleavage/methylation domain-containing protein [Listeria ivanovii]MCJ1722649.1 prepilin-type N-terminal cleavage/methylation domain-containing protein [Listeria ivanovii]